MKINLIGNNTESEILYQNDELVIFQQENVKWIVTNDNQVLMTVKDIGLLGGNNKKTERYELDLRKKGFIVPYSLNDSFLIYEKAIKSALTGNEHGNLPILYNYPAITQIIAELRTDKARERNQKLGLLQEEIRTKGYFISKGAENKAFKHLQSLRADANNVFTVLTDVFAAASDYDPKDPELRNFFGTLRNKLYQCAIGQTAAEILYDRADYTKENMNLITFKGKGKPTKADAQRAIGYLTEEEVNLLIEITNVVLGSLRVFTMKEGNYKQQQTIDVFNFYINSFADKNPTGYGKISVQKAKNYAIGQYDKFKRRLTSA